MGAIQEAVEAVRQAMNAAQEQSKRYAEAKRQLDLAWEHRLTANIKRDRAVATLTSFFPNAAAAK